MKLIMLILGAILLYGCPRSISTECGELRDHLTDLGVSMILSKTKDVPCSEIEIISLPWCGNSRTKIVSVSIMGCGETWSVLCGQRSCVWKQDR